MRSCQRWRIAFENLDVSTMQKRRDSVGNGKKQEGLGTFGVVLAERLQSAARDLTRTTPTERQTASPQRSLAQCWPAIRRQHPASA